MNTKILASLLVLSLLLSSCASLPGGLEDGRAPFLEALDEDGGLGVELVVGHDPADEADPLGVGRLSGGCFGGDGAFGARQCGFADQVESWDSC